MPRCEIILLLVALMAGCQPAAPQSAFSVAPLYATPPYVVPAPGAPQTIHSQPPATIVPGPPLPQPTGVPVLTYPQQVPPAINSHTPPVPAGLQPVPDPAGIATSPLPGILGGSSLSPEFGLPSEAPTTAGLPNPLNVGVADDGFAWEQIADVVSDYFPIAVERRARRAGEVWSDGFIETAPQTGATFFEPQRRDSVGEFNRWESTLQTIRRRAIIRVTPTAGSYLVAVEVQKELEDLPRPEQSTAGTATLRTDGSLPARDTFNVSRTRQSQLWIALGRDLALEQRILADLQERFSLAPPSSPPFAAR